MKIYAIRDRLLDYYMQPFAGPEDKAVLASIARMINTNGETSDIAQAPHHFEVWELGTIDEEGNITPTRKLVADCSALVRPGVRERHAGSRPEDGPAAEISRGKVPSTYPDPRAAQRAPTAAVAATEDETVYSSPPPEGPAH